MNIAELLKADEGKMLEFKRDLSSPQKLLKTLVAFANTAGGRIVDGPDAPLRLRVAVYLAQPHPIEIQMAKQAEAQVKAVTLQASRGTARRAPTVKRFGKWFLELISTTVRPFNSAKTKYINELRQTPDAKLWQRNYWEHIIRNDDELNRNRQYLIDNPAQQDTDRNNPNAVNQDTTIKNDFKGVGR